MFCNVMRYRAFVLQPHLKSAAVTALNLGKRTVLVSTACGPTMQIPYTLRNFIVGCRWKIPDVVYEDAGGSELSSAVGRRMLGDCGSSN